MLNPQLQIDAMINEGWVLFPLASGSKHPPKGTSGHLSWTMEDTQDVYDDLIGGLYNVAIQTGKRSGIVVLDVDPKHGGTLEAVEELVGGPIKTRTHRTRSGGWHLIFKYPENEDRIPCSVGRLAPGVDVRADGGYVVAPPSVVVADGYQGSYSVLDDSPVTDLPMAILSRIKATNTEIPDSHYQYPEEDWEMIKRWHRENVREAANAVEGERDDTVYRCMVKSFQLMFCVPETVLNEQKIVSDYSTKVPYRIKGLAGKVERARKYAEVTPRPHPVVEVPDLEDGDGPDWMNIDENEYHPDPHALDDDALTDAGNARRLVNLFRDRLRFVEGMGWLIWDGKVWRPESENSASVMQMVRNAQMLLYRDLAARVMAEMPSRDAKRHVQYSLGAKGLKNAIDQMAATYSIRLTMNELDAHPHLLTVKNGIIDLRTGDLVSHDPRYHLTRLIDIDYDPSARAERWERFLEEVMPGMPDMPGFLQRLVGYGITGEISEHAMAIHYGKGRNGKSVFLDTLRNIFGPISAVADWSSFERKAGGAGAARPDLVRLRGARLVTVNEGDSRSTMDEAQIKRMVAGDTITARGLYQSEIEYKPQFLLQMATNAKPDITGADEGIWSRVKLIPWERYFEPHERDPKLTQTLASEAQGILAWAVRGAIEWYANGLREPDVVINATKDYRESSDILGGFIGSVEDGGWLVPEDNKKVPGDWAFKLYRAWAEAQGYMERDLLTQKKFKAAMEERGFTPKRRNGGMVYLGLAGNMDIPTVAQVSSTGKIKPDRANGETEASVVEMW